ncbi:3'-nucleotidase [Magnetococcus marinus MC-1]|uniref:5'-nucleotidase SurE n=1 Tax=Magnetococcus marinus (strain ATCC BAA-1437 / JCM 17883 / MC-1) TaxID=156889 RepID=SURE_MAGMM|nr:5'/3'-nucleotidase SurE [Magnetococcus marinus]A0L4K6.1 RecName: Full=5'-nucleotidase SurE; AltName: Full=Nucleoside 5'-monophosphate phosphohydrolase [Magnetococcus marinus MC-1]ABK42899.1 3'-nucleotidase [Magnetococcus marinus MC-1]
MLILLTNDDGIASPGLQALKDALKERHDVVTLAPVKDMSGTAHAISRGEDIKLTRIAEYEVAINGTPTDCVMAGLRMVLRRPPDLLVSGINMGANVAEDLSYSATAGAAWEGALSGIPSMAVSLCGSAAPWHFESAIKVTHMVIRQWLENPLPPGTFLNVNVPNVPEYELKNPKPTRQGLRFNWPPPPVTAAGNPAFWDPTIPTPREEEFQLATDEEALRDGFTSVTALHCLFRHPHATERLKAWSLFR